MYYMGTSTVCSLQVLHNHLVAVSGSQDLTLRVWDIQWGKCFCVLAGHVLSVIFQKKTQCMILSFCYLHAPCMLTALHSMLSAHHCMSLHAPCMSLHITACSCMLLHASAFSLHVTACHCTLLHALTA